MDWTFSDTLCKQSHKARGPVWLAPSTERHVCGVPPTFSLRLCSVPPCGQAQALRFVDRSAAARPRRPPAARERCRPRGPSRFLAVPPQPPPRCFAAGCSGSRAPRAASGSGAAVAVAGSRCDGPSLEVIGQRLLARQTLPGSEAGSRGPFGSGCARRGWPFAPNPNPGRWIDHSQCQ